MRRAVRISADAVDPNEDYKRMYFDTVLGEDDRVADDETIFGLQGSKDHKGSCAPFALRFDGVDGELDWGDSDEDTSYATMDVRSKALQQGTPLELIYNGKVHEYRITSVEERSAQ
jgi:hypothetical protein